MGFAALQRLLAHLSPSWSSKRPWHISSRPSVASKRNRLTPMTSDDWVGWRTGMCWRAISMLLSQFLDVFPTEPADFHANLVDGFAANPWILPSKFVEGLLFLGLIPYSTNYWKHVSTRPVHPGVMQPRLISMIHPFSPSINTTQGNPASIISGSTHVGQTQW